MWHKEANRFRMFTRQKEATEFVMVEGSKLFNQITYFLLSCKYKL